MKSGLIYQILLRVFTLPGLLFFWTRYRGLRNIPKSGKLIVCSNHKSVFDPFLLAVPFLRQIRYMAKNELFTDHGRLAGRFLTLVGAFPVRRGTGDSASVRTAEAILDAGGVVGIFPQGGCVFGNAPFRPKAGVALLAARTRAPILPVSIYCRGLLRPFKRVTVRFGKVIPCKDLPLRGTSVAGMRAGAALVAEKINAMLGEGH